MIFPDSTVNFESPLDECLIQPQPAILFVIVSKLLVQEIEYGRSTGCNPIFLKLCTAARTIRSNPSG